MATGDEEIQAQLEKLTTAVQIVHDFGQSSAESIDNPEGGVIRTIEGINKAIDDALPNYADAGAAATAAKDARDEAKAAQAAAEAAAANAGGAVASAIYKVKTYAGAASIAVTPMEATIHVLNLDRASIAISVGATSDAAGMARQITLYLNQTVGSSKVTWPANIKWANGRVPILSFTKDYQDVVTLITIDGGTNWKGFFNGGWITNA
uniref:Tail fiber protein n=2 Tax=unclassified Rosemountvirus TaxID=2738372 RepID=A0AAU8GFP6_9CAUD